MAMQVSSNTCNSSKALAVLKQCLIGVQKQLGVNLERDPSLQRSRSGVLLISSRLHSDLFVNIIINEGLFANKLQIEEFKKIQMTTKPILTCRA
jgi:hypothetical protein